MEKSYAYFPNGQILTRYDCNGLDVNDIVIVEDKYFYIHDHLGSVRLVIDDSGNVNNSYTYNPFGEMLATECNETVYNPFKFTGQWYDDEIGQYYLRARQYAPQLMRFTSRDPVKGKLKNPLSLHPYLYCQNDSINRIDINGRFWGLLPSLKSRAANASACTAAGRSGKETLIGGLSAWNGITQGWINMLNGPSDMSDKAKFAIGFAAGFGEMQIGMRTGSASLASTVAATFTSAANSAYSQNKDFWSVGTMMDIGVAAVVGGISDIGGFGDSSDVRTGIEMWLIGVDSALMSGVGQSAYDNLVR